MTDKTYALIVSQESSGDYLADVNGGIKLISFAVKDVIAALTEDGDGEYSATFVETAGINGDEVRKISKLSADGDTLAAVLKKKVAAEKRAEAPADRAVEQPV